MLANNMGINLNASQQLNVIRSAANNLSVEVPNYDTVG